MATTQNPGAPDGGTSTLSRRVYQRIPSAQMLQIENDLVNSVKITAGESAAGVEHELEKGLPRTRVGQAILHGSGPADDHVAKLA